MKGPTPMACEISAGGRVRIRRDKHQPVISTLEGLSTRWRRDRGGLMHPSPEEGDPERTSHVECSGGRIRTQTPIRRSPLRAEEEKVTSHRGWSIWCY